MSVNWETHLPYTEDDVKFLRSCKVDPWYVGNESYRRDYQQRREKTDIVGLMLKLGIVGACLAMWVVVIHWLIPVARVK